MSTRREQAPAPARMRRRGSAFGGGRRPATALALVLLHGRPTRCALGRREVADDRAGRELDCADATHAASDGVPRAGDPGPFAPSVLSDGSLEATRLCAGWLLASVLADGRTGGGSLRLDSKYTMPGHGGCAGSVAARSFWPLLARLLLLFCGVKERTLKGKNTLAQGSAEVSGGGWGGWGDFQG